MGSISCDEDRVLLEIVALSLILVVGYVLYRLCRPLCADQCVRDVCFFACVLPAALLLLTFVPPLIIWCIVIAVMLVLFFCYPLEC